MTRFPRVKNKKAPAGATAASSHEILLLKDIHKWLEQVPNNTLSVKDIWQRLININIQMKITELLGWLYKQKTLSVVQRADVPNTSIFAISYVVIRTKLSSATGKDDVFDNFQKDPDAAFYMPHVHITPTQARTMTPDKQLTHNVTAQIVKLYQELVQAPQVKQMILQRVRQLQNEIQRKRHYLRDVRLYLFGSSDNGLASKNSDVDMCITSSELQSIMAIEDQEQRRKLLKRNVYQLGAVLRSMGMLKVLPVAHARVPIIKFFDPKLGRECDISFTNMAAMRNTQLFRAYTLVDPRVRPLLFLLKHWISARAINDASQNGGTLNSYTHVLLMLSYLQLMRVIPPLQRICCGRYPSTAVHRSCVDYYNASPARICVVCGNSLPSYPAETYETYFYTGNVEKSPNEMSIGELAIGFFRYYAFEFDYANDCVSVRMGGVISRAAKGWEDQKGSRMRGMDGQPAALCVEDPFILERNCAVSAIRRSIAGIRWEYERALRALLSYRSLDQLCSKWVDWPTSYYKQLQVYQSHIQL